MPRNINERYKNDPEFRERMKANSRRRYLEMKTALALMKEQEKQKELSSTANNASNGEVQGEGQAK